MEETNADVFAIYDALSTRYGNVLRGQFVKFNQMCFYAFRPINRKSKDEQIECSDEEIVQIHLIEPEFIFKDIILRSLIAESASIYATLQNLKKETFKVDYTAISRAYRSVIRSCLIKLQDACKEELDDANKYVLYHQYISIFYSIECLWHLSEVLIISETIRSNSVVPHLLEWIRFHFPRSEIMATDLLLDSTNASNSETYWPTLKGLLLHGEIDMTRALLRFHPRSETTLFQIVDKILKDKPNCNSLSASDLQKYNCQWEYWIYDSKLKLSLNSLNTEPDLKELVQLVLGEAEAWDPYIKNSEHWYEYMPGFLYYTNPACKHFELGSISLKWLYRWSVLQNKDVNNLKLKYLDKIILSLMDNDIYQVIQGIQLIGDNHWFVTHFIDLICKSSSSEIVGQENLKEFFKLRDCLTYEYGVNLMGNTTLWHFGVNYIKNCKKGRETLEFLFTKMTLRSEKLALKVLYICKSKSFKKAEKEICKVLAKKSFNQQRYGNALEWAIRSGDTVYLTNYSTYLLQHYARTGEMLCSPILGDVGLKMFLSPRLVFLVKYLEFYELYNTKDFERAVEILIHLLESKITPDFFWPALLVDCTPLLESEGIKISAEQTCFILKHLETNLMPFIEKENGVQTYHAHTYGLIWRKGRENRMCDIIKLLRLACARNVSRSIITENSSLNKNK